MKSVVLARLARYAALVTLTASCAGATVAVASAAASEGAPLAIRKFTMQTTEEREVQGTREARLNGAEITSSETFGFENVPYSFTQAGGHPAGLTTTIEFEHQETSAGPVPTRDPKDIAVTIPVGMLGNPTAVPRCPLHHALSFTTPCPSSTQVGEIAVYFADGLAYAGPVVNVVPEVGQSAEFAIETNTKVNALLTGHVVRGPDGYQLVVASNGIQRELLGLEITFWGVPAAPVHDGERGLFCSRISKTLGVPANTHWACSDDNVPHNGGGDEESTMPEAPFLTMPDDCSAGSETATMHADSWEEPGHVTEQRYEGYASASTTMPGVTGCDALPFGPGVSVEPDTSLADAPVALNVGLSVPQFQAPDRLAAPEMSKSVITFPLGMSVSPGIVDGIQACNESGPEGINFTGPESEEVAPDGELQLAAGHCPDASIVGTAEAETPLLDVPIKGHIYLARPGCGNSALGQAPCTEKDVLDGSLYQLYLELGGTGKLADTGVNIKVRLKTDVNPASGQLTAVAEEIAQLPFSNLKVDLNGGPRAPIDNSPVCGPAVTTADFSTWAAPGTTPEGVFMPGLPDVTPSSSYEVQGCANPLGLAPGFVAGTVSPNAGKFSAFTLNINRKDREQYIKGIQVQTPPGLLGMLSSVSLCGEAEANAGTCGEGSRIGTTRVASGAGSHPFEIEGDIYLTGPHDGAPFGLSIVTNVVAGPFHLGKVIVRARISVDPVTSALTVTTDETGPYALPQIVFGVPLRLQRVTVNVDRAQFMFNPTNCKAQQIVARISGEQQALATVSSPFAVGNCTSLAFKPAFTVSTSAHTSRKQGASLDARLSYPKGAMGSYANIARVRVALPKQLPSYLPTLKKACLAGTFDADPAACPHGSIVGIARAHTPLLPVGLAGPVYFVSHGGEEFPSLIIVLQGYGVRVDLTGSTFIKNGVTSSTFKTVPDVPVDTFELYLPNGPDHALAANGNLCKVKGGLHMPTEFTAQNGIVTKQNTRIAVNGCAAARHRSVRRARKARQSTRRASAPSRSRHAHSGRTR